MSMMVNMIMLMIYIYNDAIIVFNNSQTIVSIYSLYKTTKIRPRDYGHT